jgi:hypothetical protein
MRRWSDPATWGGKVPGPGDVAIISFPVLLDVDAVVAGVRIRPGGNLVFHPGKRIRLVSTGNVVVRGQLTMRPERHAVHHSLIFLDVKERRFQGGGMKVLKTDVGLWVMDHGRLRIEGSSKLAWTRTARGVSAGARTLELQADPIGWRVGDQLVLTPTESPSVAWYYTHYDYARIASISGRTITLSRSTRYAHPAVEVKPGVVFTPEVLNLTRNVRIEGTRRGRAHIFIHSMHAQTIRHASIRNMGPRQGSGDRTHRVLGRYGLHFHHCKGGSRGSVVTGVVVSRCGSSAFVPHLSHGITFKDCISHNTVEDAYWWDPPSPTNDFLDSFSNDIVYKRCVASLVWGSPAGETPEPGSRRTGFFLGADGPIPSELPVNSCVGCVAVGVRSVKDASGFHWPEESQGVWHFEDNVAHNSTRHGIFVWQNDDRVHTISRFLGYHNGGSGISHGAYRNRYNYQDCILYANREASIYLHALSRGTHRLAFRRVRCDGAGLGPEAVLTTLHNIQEDTPTLFENCEFLGYTGLGAVVAKSAQYGDFIDFLNCTFSGNEFWIGSAVPPETTLRVQDALHSTSEIRRNDQPGTPRPEWNASLTELPSIS